MRESGLSSQNAVFKGGGGGQTVVHPGGGWGFQETLPPPHDNLEI